MVHVLQSQPPKYNTVVPTSPEINRQVILLLFYLIDLSLNNCEINTYFTHKYITFLLILYSQEELAQLLKLTQLELQNLLMFVTSDEVKDQKVSFKQSEDIFSVFMTCFLKSCTKPPPISLSDNVSQTTLASIGKYLLFYLNFD